MTINPQNIGIISFGITEVNSSNWLRQVNNCNFFNRVYYFFNEGIMCETADKVIAFKPGYFYVLPSNISLKFFYANENVSANHFYIDFAITEMFFKEKIFEIPLKSSLYLKKYLDFIISYLVEHSISTITYWNKKNERSDSQTIYSTIQSVLSTLIILFCENTDMMSDNNYSLGAVINYIQNNYKKNIKLDDLCKISALSKNQLIRSFNIRYGISPYAYIKSFRMNMAIKMLNDGYTVSKTASELGFESTAAFSTSFKKYFSVSPNTLKNNN